MLVVQGDAAATAHNIQTHELLYRAGLAAHVLVTVTNVALAVIFYDLFKVVNRRGRRDTMPLDGAVAEGWLLPCRPNRAPKPLPSQASIPRPRHS